MTNRQQLVKWGEMLQWTWGALVLLNMSILVAQTRQAALTATNETGWTILVCSIEASIFQCRWGIGNHRYLGRTWLERAEWVDARWNQRRFRRAVGRRFFADLFLLLVHGAISGWMAVSIANAEQFSHALLCLLVSDAFWLVYDARVWPYWMVLLHDSCRQIWRGRGRVVAGMRRRRTDHYEPRTWTWTNLTTAALLLLVQQVIHFFGADGTVVSLAAMGVVSLANSYADFRQTQFGLSIGN